MSFQEAFQWLSGERLEGAGTEGIQFGELLQ